MAQTIKHREYLFRPQPKRVRPLLAMALIGVTSLAAAGFSGGMSDDVQAAQPEDAARVYGALGGPERFVLERTEGGALIRFLCAERSGACREEGGEVGLSVAYLIERPTSSGTVLVDPRGEPVLTLAKGGDAVLHKGSEIVPGTVPAKGRKALPTQRTTLSLATTAGRA